MSPEIGLCRRAAAMLAIFGAAFCYETPFASAADALDRDAVRAELQMLRQRISELERLLDRQAEAPVAETHTVPEPVEPEPETTTGEVAAATGEMPEPGNGSVEIGTPGSRMTIGGMVRLDAAYNNPGGPSNYSMSTSAIPSRTAAQGARGQFSMQGRGSRFWFKTDTPVEGDHLKTLIEVDFWGSAGTEQVSNSHNIRLWHAYAEYAGFTVGQTNSTFMHAGSVPDTISDAVADIYVRQPLVRYTTEFDRGDFQIALEQPETTLIDSNGNQVIPNDDRFPDVATKVSWRPQWGLLSLSGLLRQLRIDTGGTAIGGVPAGVTDQAVGGALFASARIVRCG